MYPVCPIFPRFYFGQIFQDAQTVQHGAQFCFLRALSPTCQQWFSGQMLLGGTYHDSSANLTSGDLTSFSHLTANPWKNNLAEYDQNCLNFYDWLVDGQYDSKNLFPLWNQAKARLKIYFLWQGFLSYSALIGMSTMSFEPSWFNNFELWTINWGYIS